MVPPSITMSDPTMLVAAPDTMKATSAATSSGSVILGEAILNWFGSAVRNSSCRSQWAAASWAPMPSGPRHSAVPTTPGEMVFTRTPWGPNSSLSLLPNAVKAALASL